MSYDLENGDEVAEFAWDQRVYNGLTDVTLLDDPDKLRATDLHINGVDMAALEAKVDALTETVKTLTAKVETMLNALGDDKAIVCHKDEDGHWSCHVNLRNSHSEDEPLGI